jgi:hypothetical protein
MPDRARTVARATVVAPIAATPAASRSLPTRISTVAKETVAASDAPRIRNRPGYS